MKKSNKYSSSAFDKKIGNRIKIARQRNSKTIDSLSEEMNISSQQLSRYERGATKINVEHLYMISQILETPIGYFFENNPSIKEKDQDILTNLNSLSIDKKRYILELLNFLINK